MRTRYSYFKLTRTIQKARRFGQVRLGPLPWHQNVPTLSNQPDVLSRALCLLCLLPIQWSFKMSAVIESPASCEVYGVSFCYKIKNQLKLLSTDL